MTAKKKPRAPRALIDCFEKLEDLRMDRARDHKLIDVLVIGLRSTITIGENFTNMEDFGKAKRAWRPPQSNSGRPGLAKEVVLADTSCLQSGDSLVLTAGTNRQVDQRTLPTSARLLDRRILS